MVENQSVRCIRQEQDIRRSSALKQPLPLSRDCGLWLDPGTTGEFKVCTRAHGVSRGVGGYHEKVQPMKPIACNVMGCCHESRIHLTVLPVTETWIYFSSVFSQTQLLTFSSITYKLLKTAVRQLYLFFSAVVVLILVICQTWTAKPQKERALRVRSVEGAKKRRNSCCNESCKL